MENICIIPARSGSKRIKNKNVKEFCGKPIISYPIQTAIESKLFDEVIVYTDSQEIVTIANQYGAITPLFRTQKSANDNATLTDTIFEMLVKYEDSNKWFANICCILPTAIFIEKEDLIDSYNLFKRNNNDSLISVIQYNHPIQRAFKHFNNGQLFMINPEFEFTRTQDLTVSYHDAGQFYWIYTDSFLNQHRIFMDKMIGYQINAVDIDTEEDWKLAELKYKIKKGIV